MYRLAARTADPAEKEAQSWCLVQLGDEYWRSGRNAEAESAYDEALQNLPDYFLAVAGKARSRASAGDLETAESLLGPLNARTPNVDNIILLGDVLTLLGRATEASRHYALAEALGSGAENDRKRLAVLWADHDRRIDEALSIVRNESSRRRDIHTLDALAWTLCRAGLLSDAKSAAAEAMNLKTGDARIIYHAGMIERDLGNVAEAKRLLEAALRKNPAFDLLQAENARRVLAEIRLERRIR
jgi:tetratricopeptide (TPR) repeat protein